MSLTVAKMGGDKGSLKAQLDQEERDIKAELEAVEKAKARAVKEKPVTKGKKDA